MENTWSFEELDLIGAVGEIQTDCDICKNAIWSLENGKTDFKKTSVEYAKSFAYWTDRRNRMVSVANALRNIISYSDERFAKPYANVVDTVYLYHKALKGLTFKQIELFEQIHKKHIAAWESEIRIGQHSLSNLKKVVWVQQKNCFHAYYKRFKKLSPTWYHYTLDGTWY